MALRLLGGFKRQLRGKHLFLFRCLDARQFRRFRLRLQASFLFGLAACPGLGGLAREALLLEAGLLGLADCPRFQNCLAFRLPRDHCRIVGGRS